MSGLDNYNKERQLDKRERELEAREELLEAKTEILEEDENWLSLREDFLTDYEEFLNDDEDEKENSIKNLMFYKDMAKIDISQLEHDSKMFRKHAEFVKENKQLRLEYEFLADTQESKIGIREALISRIELLEKRQNE